MKDVETIRELIAEYQVKITKSPDYPTLSTREISMIDVIFEKVITIIDNYGASSESLD